MERYLVITNVTGHDEIEYLLVTDVVSAGIEYALFSHPDNQERMTIVDNGDGLVLEKKLKNLDYSEQHELALLLDFISKKQTNRLKHRFVKDVAL
jgi:hypothetical protein